MCFFPSSERPVRLHLRRQPARKLQDALFITGIKIEQNECYPISVDKSVIQKEATIMVIVFVILATSFILLLIAVVVKGLFRYRRQQACFEVNLDTLKADSHEEVLSTRLKVQEQSFRYVAREIHDNIGLSLTLAKLYLNTLTTDQPATRQQKLEESVTLISEAISNLRDISSSMNPDVLAGQGLLNSLDKEINKLKHLGRYEVTYSVTGQQVTLNSQQELYLLRMIQEAFNNIIKHANAHEVRIEVDFSTKSLIVNITDNGTGFSETDGGMAGNAGLLNMRNRARQLKGSCQITGTPGAGTRVRIIIPY